jgi:hypothetical protein
VDAIRLPAPQHHRRLTQPEQALQLDPSIHGQASSVVTSSGCSEAARYTERTCTMRPLRIFL